MKKCIKCGKMKDESEFNKHPKNSDGLQLYCILCDNESSRASYFNNLTYNRLKRKEWQKKNAEKQKEYIKRYQQQNKHKINARSLLNYYLKKGDVIKPLYCEKCGEQEKLYAHHHDYSKPLEVQWLCKNCHILEHHPIIEKYLKRDMAGVK